MTIHLLTKGIVDHYFIQRLRIFSCHSKRKFNTFKPKSFMRKIFFLLLLAFFPVSLFSQDLIVTDFGDSILCKITSLKNRKIYFLCKSEGETRGLNLPLAAVKIYKVGYYSKKVAYNRRDTSVNNPYRRSLPVKKTDKDAVSPVVISIYGGLSIEPAKLSADIPFNLRDYYHDLQSGMNINGSISYFYSDQLGIGFKYQRFMSSNTWDNATFSTKYGSRTGKLSDKLKISFFGPSLTLRTVYGNGNALYSNYFIGYVRYRDDAVVISPVTITGGTLGIGLDAGYEIEVTEHFHIGFQASFIAGGVREFKTINGNGGVQTIKLEDDNYESIHRLDFSIGIMLR